jgi:hypothetical protein
MGDRGELDDLDGLRELAELVAAGWKASASRATTAGRERAIMRLFGVGDLDRDGQPLAGRVVERYLASNPARLAGGIALPFSMAMVEYDLPPQELALNVASGAVDLGLEASLLEDPDRRAAATAQATALALAARDRVDANRTARLELRSLLGDAPRPWGAAMLLEPAIVDAVAEASRAITTGADVIAVEIPPGRELAQRAAGAGRRIEPWHPAPTSRGGLGTFDPGGPPVPAGSQRALRVLRRAVDEAAAERGAYVRLATWAPLLGAPEQAVVAGFERLDLVAADPVQEIVAGRIDPDRAMADHAFAYRLLARADAALLVSAGPLLVAPDLAAGMPSDAATRSGRALALQLAVCAFARGLGMPPDGILAGAIPDWTVDEPRAPACAAAEVDLRRQLLPDHPLGFVEPPRTGAASLAWWALVSALLPGAPSAGLVALRGPRADGALPALAATTRVASGLGNARGPSPLAGVALDHARAVVTIARATLEALLDRGWPAVLGGDGSAGEALGADAVASLVEPFDPLVVQAGEPPRPLVSA